MKWNTILMNDLHVLKQFSGPDKASQELYAMKEQEIGLHCYLAEENLNDAELALLKQALRMSELRWRFYKSRIWPPPASFQG